MANVVVILGSEKKIDFKIDIFASEENVKKATNALKKAGYNSINQKSEKDMEKSIVEYNKEDYFIAQKIAKVLKIEDMVENNDLENRVNITIK